jgi:hypothetical protein
MASSTDPWYVRLPDGRTLRARSTEALRESLSSGRIPWESRVRRSPDRAWLPVRRVPELADLQQSESARLAESAPARPSVPTPAELRAVGVRGLVEELLNALDSSLSRRKLIPAVITGLCAGVALLVVAVSPLFHDWRWLGMVAGALLLVISLSVCTSWLTQMTYIELARLRPARHSELRIGLFRYSWRLVLAQVVVGTLFVGPLILLYLVPGWLGGATLLGPEPWQVSVRSGLAIARLLLEVLGWPIFLMGLLLLGPVLVIEDYSVGTALREWWGMLRRHIGRIYLYEALAFAIGGIMTLPLLLPIALTAATVIPGRGLTLVTEATLSVLFGVAMTPLFAYLLVANVFIYLNLRYEFFDHIR